MRDSFMLRHALIKEQELVRTTTGVWGTARHLMDTIK